MGGFAAEADDVPPLSSHVDGERHCDCELYSVNVRKCVCGISGDCEMWEHEGEKEKKRRMGI